MSSRCSSRASRRSGAALLSESTCNASCASPARRVTDSFAARTSAWTWSADCLPLACAAVPRHFGPADRRPATRREGQLVPGLVLEQEERPVVAVDELPFARAHDDQLAGDRRPHIGHGAVDRFFVARRLAARTRLEIRRLAASARG